MAAGDGLVIMTPTSITHAGTSASINSDGGVDFTAVTSLSLNGVFTSSFDNYLVVVSYDCSINDVGFTFRMRAAGTDNSTASSYVSQALNAESTTVGGSRSTSTSGQIGVSGDAQNGRHLHFYGPALAQPTAFRSVGVGSVSGAVIGENAVTHNQSTSYDGFTIFIGSGNITGNIVVFGYEE
jgi:hypothetical protein